MVFGGFAAHRGWLSLVPWVILIGALATPSRKASGSSGPLRRPKGSRKRAGWAAKVEQADRLLAKWEGPVVVGARFIPGFNTTAVIALALSAMSSKKFLALNAIGAAVWALTFGVLGYAVGQAVERYIGDIERYEKPVALGLLAAGCVWVVWHYARAFRSRRGGPG